MQDSNKPASNSDQKKNEIARPLVHFSPVTGWVNDPNGMVFYAGEYHFFYQYHPNSIVWGPMHWGHAISCDLVNWEHLPIALYPDDNGMIFSGSAVVDWNNSAGFGKEALIIFFTYNKDFQESQNLAYSTDHGRTWTKFKGNPVLPAPPGVRDIRDPKVFWYGNTDAGHWVMCLAAGDVIRFYTSKDLLTWRPGSMFGFVHGTREGVWETPDLFNLPVGDGSETRWVLTVGVGAGGPAGGSGTQYFIGQFDGITFTSENPQETVLWVDHGADYYAPQSWSDAPDNRRLMVGWMNNWEYARLVPASTWRGMFSLPRELSLSRTPDGIRLRQKPAAELQSIREKHFSWQNQTIPAGARFLTNIRSVCFEILAELEIAPPAGTFAFEVRSGDGESTMIGYDLEQQKVFVDRTRSGKTGFHELFAARHEASMTPKDGKVWLQILVDQSCVEVFGNDGEVVLTDSIFPDEQSQAIGLKVNKGILKINTLDVFLLKPAKFGESLS